MVEEPGLEFFKKAMKIVANEHSQMPKTCNSCGGNMKFVWQELFLGPEPGDVLVYECEKCGKRVEKFFKFPSEYLSYFRIRFVFKNRPL